MYINLHVNAHALRCIYYNNFYIGMICAACLDKVWRILTIVSIKTKGTITSHSGIILVPVSVTHRTIYSILTDCNPASVGETTSTKKLSKIVLICNIDNGELSVTCTRETLWIL